MQSQWWANEADLRFQYSRKVTAVEKEVTFIKQKFHYEAHYYIGTGYKVTFILRVDFSYFAQLNIQSHVSHCTAFSFESCMYVMK